VGYTLNLIEVEPNNELAPTGRQTNKEVVYLLTEWGLARSAEAPHSLLGVWDECAGVGRDGN